MKTNGRDPRRRDVLAAAAARAHADAEPDDQEAAARHGVSRRTGTRWRHEGPPVVRGFQTYLWGSPDPWRVAQDAVAVAKHRTVSERSTADLIEDYRALLAHECDVEAEDRRCDVTRGTSWLDRSAASVRDAAVDAHKAAIEREFACRGLTEEEVFGG